MYTYVHIQASVPQKKHVHCLISKNKRNGHPGHPHGTASARWADVPPFAAPWPWTPLDLSFRQILG